MIRDTILHFCVCGPNCAASLLFYLFICEDKFSKKNKTHPFYNQKRKCRTNF